MDIGFWFPRPDRGARLASELRALGHRVTIYHAVPSPNGQTDWVCVPYHWRSGFKVLSNANHDVLYTSRSLIPVLQLAWNRRMGSRKPFVYTVNGAFWAYWSEGTGLTAKAKGLLRPRLFDFALRSASAVVTNSDFLGRELSDRFPHISPRLRTIYNGYESRATADAPQSTTEWPVGTPRIVSVVTAELQRKRLGIHLLLDAFSKIAVELPEASYVMAVKASSEEAVAAIRIHAERLPGANRILIERNRSDVGSLLRSDIFMYATPSDSSDSLPRVLLEAQDAAIPIVATNTTGCGEVVRDGATGTLVPYAADALADAVIRCWSDMARSKEMAQAGQADVRRRFSWESMALDYQALFDQIRDR